MADPLSISASVITLFGAAEGLGKYLTYTSSAFHASEEILAPGQ